VFRLAIQSSISGTGKLVCPWNLEGADAAGTTPSNKLGSATRLPEYLHTHSPDRRRCLISLFSDDSPLQSWHPRAHGNTSGPPGEGKQGFPVRENASDREGSTSSGQSEATGGKGTLHASTVWTALRPKMRCPANAQTATPCLQLARSQNNRVCRGGLERFRTTPAHIAKGRVYCYASTGQRR